MSRMPTCSAKPLHSLTRGQSVRQVGAPPLLAKQQQRVGTHYFRTLAPAGIAAVVLGSLASPAIAAPEANARLVHCGAQSCLRITGQRENSASTVGINGHAVRVEGNRTWQADLPVELVREWSPPYARTVEVSLQNPETQRQTVTSIDLPIGLLGVTTNLASLVVSVR